MRIICLVFCLCLSSGIYANPVDSTLQRYRAQLSFVYAVPLGAFSNSDNYIIGKINPGSGIAFLFSARLTDHISIGLHFSDIFYKLNTNNIYNQVAARYKDPGYYTTIDIYNSNYEIGISAIMLSYSLFTHFAEIEPYLLLGTGTDNSQTSYYSIMIHRKKKNDNYSEDIYQELGGNNTFFYPGIGLRLNKKITRILSLSLGTQYNYGVLDYTINERRADFLNNRSNAVWSYSTPVSSFNIEAGLQFRFRKMHRQTNKIPSWQRSKY